ncbi:TPA: hypothetical protein DDW35_13920 [Candidatus Sumerlaeota bacterium]|nr:hypothetical protein [Candidatus Sumerlaeota bacterium]
MLRILFFLTVLFFITLAPVLGETTGVVATRPTSAPKTVTPTREAATPSTTTTAVTAARTSSIKLNVLPRQLHPGLSDAELERLPTTRWFRMLDEFQTQYAVMELRSAEQSKLLDQLAVLRQDSKKTTLLPSSTGKTQELIHALHLAQQGIEDIRKNLDTVGVQEIPHLPKVYTELQQLQETWLKKQKEAATDDAKTQATRLLAVLEENLNVVEDIQTAPDTIDEKILRYVERKAAATPESPRNLTFRRLQERTEKLEREQWLIEQRLEDNKRELENIQTEIERVLKTQTRTHLTTEEEAPAPKARPVPPKL